MAGREKRSMAECNTANSNTARLPAAATLISSRRCFCHVALPHPGSSHFPVPLTSLILLQYSTPAVFRL
jgi:hypothetical protein